MERSLERLRHALGRNGAGAGEALDTEPHRRQFFDAMDDDLNTPRALAALFDLAREINRSGDAGNPVSAAQESLRDLGGILGLAFDEPQAGKWSGHRGRAVRRVAAGDPDCPAAGTAVRAGRQHPGRPGAAGGVGGGYAQRSGLAFPHALIPGLCRGPGRSRAHVRFQCSRMPFWGKSGDNDRARAGIADQGDGWNPTEPWSKVHLGRGPSRDTPGVPICYRGTRIRPVVKNDQRRGGRVRRSI